MFTIIQNGLTTESLIVLVAFIVALLFSISAHEFAHAYVAHKLGDLTPKSQGRLTLNPFAHFDLIGGLMLLFFGFGYAKPVQINPIRFKDYRKGIFLVSIAGVVTNLFIAFFASAISVLLSLATFEIDGILRVLWLIFNYISIFLVSINLSLALFNLLPIFPLDGFNILSNFLRSDNKFLMFMKRYGNILLLVLVLSTALSRILNIIVPFISVAFYSFWSFLW